MNTLYGFALGVWNMLRGYTTQFNNFESAILDRVSELMVPDVRAKFEKRRSNINRIYRPNGGTEIIAYEVEDRKNVFPSETAVISKGGTVKIANFTIRSQHEMTKLSGSLIINNGNFGIMKFDRSSEHADCSSIVAIEITINKIEKEIRDMFAPK